METYAHWGTAMSACNMLLEFPKLELFRLTSDSSTLGVPVTGCTAHALCGPDPVIELNCSDPPVIGEDWHREQPNHWLPTFALPMNKT